MPAVIFDLDGVLIDSEALQHRAYAVVLERFGVTISTEEYAVHWVAHGRGPAYAVETYHLPLTADALKALKQPIYHDILQREVRVMPGAVDAVARLHTQFPLAIATNSGQVDLSFVVDHFDLRRFFAILVGREDYAHPKPAPDAYVTAAQRLGIPAAQCVVVEDAYRGIVAARAAGAVPVAVPHAYTRDNDFSRAARVLQSLDELTIDLVSEVLRQTE